MLACGDDGREGSTWGDLRMTSLDERWRTESEVAAAATSASDARWRAFMAALAQWMERGGARPKFDEFFADKHRGKLLDDGRE